MLNTDSSSRLLSSIIKERVLVHLSYLKKTLSSYQKPICAVKLIQFILIIILLFKSNLFFYLQNSTSSTAMEVLLRLRQTINQILSYIFQTEQVLIVMGIIVALLLVLKIGHCYFLQIQFRTERHQLVSKQIQQVIVLFYLALALVQVPCLYTLGKMYSQTQNVKWLVMICLNVISFWPFTIIQFTVCPIVFDLFVLLIVPIFTLTQSNYKFLLITVLSLFQFWIKPHKFEKVFYVIVGLISAWNFIDKQIIKFTLDSLSQDKLVLIGFCILLLTYLLIKAASYYQINQHQNDSNLVLGLILKTKTQNLLQSNSFQTVFKVWQKTLKFLQKSDESLNNQLKQKQIQNLTKTDLIRCLRQHVRELITSERDIPNRILYLKLKILQKVKLIQIIQGVQSLMSITTHNNLSIREEFLLVQFQKYVQQKLFASIKDKQLNTAFLIEKALVTQEFYNSAAQSFREVIRFWQFFRCRQKSKQETTAFFQRISKSENQLRSKYQRLSEYRNIERETKIMVQIQHLLNGHSLVSEYNLKSNEGSIYSLQRGESQVENSFLVLEEKRIIRCSFEFLNEMGYSEQELINADRVIIFGERFVQNLQAELREVTFESKRLLVLPVFNKQRDILIKQCSVLIFPQMKSQVKYLISFTDIHQVSDSPIIIYSPLTDSIQFVTPRFITQFQLDPYKISHKITHSNFLSNELFSKIDLSSPQTKQLLKQKKPVNCQIVLKNLSSINLQKIPINITFITQFSTSAQNFHILLIKKGIYIKTEMTLTEHEETKLRFETDENLNQAEKYRDQKFFCPISNNYSIKITQKLSQISDKGRKNYIFYMVALFTLTSLLLIAQITYYYIQTEQRINDLKSDHSLIYNKNNDYIQISQLYSLLFKIQYFKKYPQSLSLITRDQNIDQVLDFYIGEMQKTVRNFLNDHLNSLRQSIESSLIEYQLRFDSFQIITDTLKTTFIDFSQKFSQYVKTFQRQFLFANYLSFRNVAEKFFNVDLSTDKIAQTFSSSLFTAYITLIVSIPLALIGLLISIKIQFSINQMYKLLQLLEEKDSQQVLDRINKLKEKLKEVESLFKKKLKQNQSAKFSTARIIQETDKVRQEENNQLSINNMKMKSFSEKQSEIEEENEPLSSGNVQILQTKEQKPADKRESQTGPVLVIALRNIYTPIFLGIVGIVIYLQIDYRNNQQDIFKSLFYYQKELFQAQISIYQLENDFYFKAQYTQFYNLTNLTFYQSHTYSNLHSYSNLQNRTQFATFNQQQYLLLFNDLCERKIDYFITFRHLKCSAVADGILSNGFSQTFQVYSKLALQMKNKTLNQFLTRPCKRRKCPAFIEQFYLNIKLSTIIADHIKNFRDFFQTVSQNQSESNSQILIIQLCLIFSLYIVFAIWIHFLSRRCKRSIKMFQIIPPHIMKKMKMTTFIRKNNILSCLSVL